MLGRHDALLREGAETLDGPTVALGARDRRASWASTSWPARSSSAARATTSSPTPSVHVGPDGEVRGVYRKIHMFDVTVEGKEYRESGGAGARATRS